MAQLASPPEKPLLSTQPGLSRSVSVSFPGWGRRVVLHPPSSWVVLHPRRTFPCPAPCRVPCERASQLLVPKAGC